MRTISLDDVRVGHRYVKTIHADDNPGWAVASIKRYRSALQTRAETNPGVRGWVPIDLVTVTYRNGGTVTFRAGEQVAIDGDVIEVNAR